MIRILALVAALTVTTTRASHQFSYGNGPLYPIQARLISQSVHLNEVPTKIIKITKTVAVKVPVPYPVKIPHHIPVPVPVNHPIAVPVPQIVKVPHHVPVEVEKPVPVELPQQVPLYLTKTLALPHPVPVPQLVAINRPVYYPVPHPVPYPAHHDDHHHHHRHHDHHDPHHFDHHGDHGHSVSLSLPFTVERCIVATICLNMAFSEFTVSSPLESLSFTVFTSTTMHASLYAKTTDFDAKEGAENDENADEKAESQQAADTHHGYGYFRPSQPDYGSEP
ncbi:hypothetical protein TSAR_012228 [Trichomalopsis sarcophagae]|uniref:VM domain-containing protein n=1 Tax=Trichomalopsis sarcophagae TaxID=543379 RepID=A0A232EPV0_9HYME|nr:hypothetical protein TSAR_012228 [Trichomalopsis sarcophagae]